MTDVDGSGLTADELDSGRWCRVCRGGSAEGPLRAPCKCDGSIRWIHEACLLEWLRISGKPVDGATCELCSTPFVFTSVYAEGAPRVMGPLEIGHALLLRFASPLRLLLRVLLALVMWGVVMPLASAFYFEVIFMRSLSEIESFVQTRRAMPQKLLSDLGVGFCVMFQLVGWMALSGAFYEGLQSLSRRLRRIPVLFDVKPLRTCYPGRPCELHWESRGTQAGTESGTAGTAGTGTTTGVGTEIGSGEDEEAAADMVVTGHFMPETRYVYSPKLGDHNDDDDDEEEDASWDVEEDEDDDDDEEDGLVEGDVHGMYTEEEEEDEDGLDHEEDSIMDLSSDDDDDDDDNEEEEEEEDVHVGGGGNSVGYIHFHHNASGHDDDEDADADSDDDDDDGQEDALLADVPAGFQAAGFLNLGDTSDHGAEDLSLGYESEEMEDDDYAEPYVHGSVAPTDLFIFADQHQHHEHHHHDAAQGGVDGAAEGLPEATQELDLEQMFGLKGSLYVAMETCLATVTNLTVLLGIAVCIPFQLAHFLPVDKMLSRQLIRNDWVMLAVGHLAIGTFLGSIAALAWLARSLLNVPYLFVIRVMLTAANVAALFVKVVSVCLDEYLIFPLLIGCWINVCSLDLTGGTLQGALVSLRGSPVLTIASRWFVGFTYMVVFSLFLERVRSVTRRHVLWFLRSADDPEFSLVRELFELSMRRHMMRFLSTMTKNGMVVVLLVWVPIQVAKLLTPAGTLPMQWQVHGLGPFASGSVVSVSMRILVYQYWAMMCGHPIVVGFSKYAQHYVLAYLRPAARILSLESYLLAPEHTSDPETYQRRMDFTNPEDVRYGFNRLDEDMDERPEAALERDERRAYFRLGAYLGPAYPEGYARSAMVPPDVLYPNAFRLRVLLMLMGAWVCAVVCHVLLITVPVVMGRALFAAAVRGVSQYLDVAPETLETKDDMFALLAISLVFSYVVRALMHVYRWWAAQPVWRTALPTREHVVASLRTAVVQSVLFFLLVVFGGILLPVLLGMVFEVTIMVPLYLPLDGTHLFQGLWKFWMLGFLFMITLPRISALRQRVRWGAALDHHVQLFANGGVRQMDARAALVDVVLPSLQDMILFLTVPYVVIHGVLPLTNRVDAPTRLLLSRYSWLAVAGCAILGFLLHAAALGFAKMHAALRDDKYRIGTRLGDLHHGAFNDDDQEEEQAPLVDQQEPVGVHA